MELQNTLKQILTNNKYLCTNNWIKFKKFF